MIPEVAHSSDFQRVFSLPRRTWAAADLSFLADELTSILRTPGGTMRLRPVQALALYEAGTCGGLFGPIGVGEGKTLVTLLLAVVFGAQRPLLLLPAGLIEKTRREQADLSKHWKIPAGLRIFSYDMLGRVQAANELETAEPDAIICDEVHRLKNRRAAVTRRVARYMHAHAETKFAGLSGTVMDKSLKDFAHLLLWALKLEAPVPTTLEEIQEWSDALDEGDLIARRRPGALMSLCTPEERIDDTVTAVRHGFRRRMTETPGVVATIGEGEHVDCSIYVRGITYGVKTITDQHVNLLRKTWKTPDDWQLMLAAEVWAHVQQMALGLYYMWDPRPPTEWREARKAWNSFVRETISRSRTFDSELHVANACDAGRLDDSYIKRWRAVRPTYNPNVVPVWFDDSAIEAVAEWMHSPGIVWTEHRFFAERLSEATGCPYYGAQGLDAKGRYIEDAKARTIIASIDANREGKNLQRLWSRNLLVCPPTSAAWWEQVIARTHRPGQTADEVIVDVLLGCRENYTACEKAIEGARAIQQMTGKIQKLLLADVSLPTEAGLPNSPRWAA